ncbi:MAG: hypothetical protein GX234_12610 [Clostridiales bacterium]|nr:hypothetical protein [Clostridiales bacterium]
MEMVEGIKNFVANNPQYRLYENYSGRVMFGKTCLGVVVRSGDSFMDFLMKLTRYLDEQGIEDTALTLEGVSYDELGLDIVIYFPNIKE